jgi:hypothetical protein
MTADYTRSICFVHFCALRAAASRPAFLRNERPPPTFDVGGSERRPHTSSDGVGPAAWGGTNLSRHEEDPLDHD